MKAADLIGSSPKFQAVLDKVAMVASVHCSVLIQGETGTGKELVARAIHDASPRRDQPFVAVNCAAIPSALLENELFGHDRGAFTGAVTQTKGRFRAAEGGTLFLDEIGDLPLELQPKLLRVLQEGEFEPLGSSQSIQVDVRVIVATHQDLWRMVQEGKFRADLYYRLNVFPIALPPLRERREDIPLLVEHFVHKFALQQGKSIHEIPNDVKNLLGLHPWPGNVRELQNVLERAVIMTTGPLLDLNTKELMTPTADCETPRTLTDAQRSHIIATLREANWAVGGPNGAAARLGLPRTTLIGMMKRLKISPERVQSINGCQLSSATPVNGAYALASDSGYGALSTDNQAVVHSRHETRLYQEICDAVTDGGGYLLAWIGFAENNPRKSVRILGRSGRSGEYVNALEVTWGENPLGQGPAGTSIRSGNIAIFNDLANDPRFLPWRKRAGQFGCSSSAALPLRFGRKRVGIISIYAAEPEAFRPSDINVLQKSANELLNTGHRYAQLRLAVGAAAREMGRTTEYWL
ncbi:MAG TPA: sigma 54-interacting transcriptional regulator [Bryobacteraceae bacterium]|nr:sigma 54-interacting transcriptional regulator [Bryobacteraceae bacterium]